MPREDGDITASYLEVWGPGGRELRPLDGDRVTVGTDDSSDLAVDDQGLSRVHAVFERYGDAWCVRDLGSRNGTFVNGERVLSERALHTGDEVRLGKLRIVFTSPAGRSQPTGALEPPPSLTQREREVLVALCRPLLGADAFTEPASIRSMAEELFVTEAAVKQHLSRLYDKFGIPEGEERRRVRLANAAVERGAVKLGDLKPGR